MQLLTVLASLVLLILPTSAQFQFFEHMFGGQQQHQQAQPQNMPSDASWFQQQYEGGMSLIISPHLFLLEL